MAAGPSGERRRRDDDPGEVDPPGPGSDGTATWEGEGGGGDYTGGPTSSPDDAGRTRDPEGNPELM